MRINLLKIGKISTKKELEKYPIDEPYFYNNYLFHYLIMTNNLKALKLVEFPVYEFNEENYNGFMLAAKYNYYDILTYLVNNYKAYIFDTNSYNETFLHYLDPAHNNYVQFIINNNLTRLFYKYNDDEISPLDYIFSHGSYNNIVKLINNINFKYGDYEKTPFYYNLLSNEGLKTEQIIEILKILEKKDKRLYQYVDNTGNNFLFPIVLKNNLKLLKYFDNKNINFDYYTPIVTNHIFKIAYLRGISTNDYKMASYIIDKIIDKHDFYNTDKNGNNIAHFILQSKKTFHKGNSDIEDKILNKYKLWDNKNTNNETVIDYMKELKMNNKYYKGYKNESEEEEIKLQSNKYSHGNIFQARFTDIALFFHHIMKKYKNIYLPKYNGKYDHSKYINITFPETMLNKYNNFPWLVVWNNKSDYYIHPQLNKLMNKNKKKYDYGIVLLSLRLPDGGLHASLLLYDFKHNIIERFDPYGDTSILDSDMDNLLKQKLTLNTKFKYYSPKMYFPVAGFQTLSDENNPMNQKMGDFGGYCLAWTLWYIEHRNMNKKIEPKKLIRKTLNKFLSMKLKPDEYIRNYANSINKERIKLLKQIGLTEKEASNEALTTTNYNKIVEFIKKKL